MRRTYYSLTLLLAVVWGFIFQVPLSLVYEFGIKEAPALFLTAQNFGAFPFQTVENPHFVCEKTPKVVIMLHGSGGGPYMFLPLIQKLRENPDIQLITVKLEPSEENLIPVNNLQEKIDEVLNGICKKARHVEIALIGHSLGAHTSAKYIWRDLNKDPRVNVSLFISIAGRLKDAPNDFEWFYEAIKPEMEMTWQAIQKGPRPTTYTIYGTDDDLVPQESVHIFGDPSRELTVPGYGHMGILYSPEVIDHIALWINQWAKP